MMKISMQKQIVLIAIFQSLQNGYIMLLILLDMNISSQSFRNQLILISLALVIILKLIEVSLLNLRNYHHPIKYEHILHTLSYLINIASIIELNITNSKFTHINIMSNTLLTLVLYFQLQYHLRQLNENLNFSLILPVYIFIRFLVQTIIETNVFQIDSLIFIILIQILQIHDRNILSQHESLNPIDYSKSNGLAIKIEEQPKEIDESHDIKILQQDQVNVQINDANQQQIHNLPNIKSRISNHQIFKIMPKTTVHKNLLSSDHSLYQQNSNLSSFERPEQLIQFYQSLMNNFPSGIMMINPKCKIIYSNQTCERLFDCSNKKYLFESFLSLFKKAKCRDRDKKTGGGFHINKLFIPYIKLDEYLQLLQKQNKEQDILEQFLYPEKLIDSMSQLNFQLIEKYNPYYDISQQKEIQMSPITLLLSKSCKGKKKFLQLTFHLSNLTNFQSDLISCPSHQRVSFYLQQINDQHQIQPFLLVLIKNVSSKKELQKIQKEYQFQNQLLKSFSHELRTPLNCSIQMLNVALEFIQKQDKFLNNYITSALSSNQLLIYQINDILDFAAIECYQFHYRWSQINLKSIEREILELYTQACAQKKITFLQKFDQKLEKIILNSDRERILQILVNLMNNSIKFTKQDGIIRLSFKLKKLDYVKISIKDNGVGFEQEKLISLQRIMKTKRTLFQRMKHSVNQNSVNLGLNIANKLVQGLTQENYNLNIKSEVNKKTKISFLIQNIENDQLNSNSQKKKNENDKNENFNVDMNTEQLNLKQKMPSINLVKDRHEKKDRHERSVSIKPLIDKHLSPTQQSNEIIQTSQKMINFDKPIILIVDDVPFNQIALIALISKYNFIIDQAFDGQQAINFVKNKLKNQEPPYSLIFMDIEMPGIDGFQTTLEVNYRLKIITFQIKQILAKNQKNCFIAMCSAYDTEENINKGILSGMDDFIAKPVKKQDLERVIQKINCIQPS